ncbi:MAG: hypothetical protein RLZ47_1337 [Bacteroidota bacterium]|jgi:hypothetical protein
MRNRLSTRLIVFTFVLTLANTITNAQIRTLSDGKRANNVLTTLPFLLISPDARAGAMGDVGAATKPDSYSIHWNAAKMAFLEQKNGLSLSYSPWLKNLVPDVNFAYVTGFHRLDERSVMGGSIRYFSIGEFQLTDANQNPLGVTTPNEIAIDLAYSRQFGEYFSLGMALRYINSNLQDISFAQMGQNAVNAVSADVSAYFHKQVQFLNTATDLSFGLNLSNIGNKVRFVSYAPQDASSNYFLPANMRLGTALAFRLPSEDKFTFALDLNKLLVPTSPITDEDGNILQGQSSDRSVISGMFNSFSDAPGGFSEELQEISYSLGLEYSFKDKFPIRAGYFYEHPNKGDRQFFTLGTGIYGNKFDLDLSYILANQTESPLANTLRFSMSYYFGQNQKNK